MYVSNDEIKPNDVKSNISLKSKPYQYEWVYTTAPFPEKLVNKQFNVGWMPSSSKYSEKRDGDRPWMRKVRVWPHMTWPNTFHGNRHASRKIRSIFPANGPYVLLVPDRGCHVSKISNRITNFVWNFQIRKMNKRSDFRNNKWAWEKSRNMKEIYGGGWD